MLATRQGKFRSILGFSAPWAYGAVLTSLLAASACSGDDRPPGTPLPSGGRNNTAGSLGSPAGGASSEAGGGHAAEGSGDAGARAGEEGGAPPTGNGGPQPDPTLCGDGALDPFETCDDDNHDSGDGCDETCQVEPGYTCAKDEPCRVNQVDAPCEEACFDADACLELGSGVTCECPEKKPAACVDVSFRSLVLAAGYTACSPSAISGDGTTVAGSCSRLDQNEQERVDTAVVWELGGGVQVLGEEPDGIVLTDINADGSVLVGYDGQGNALRFQDGKSEILSEDGAARATSADGAVVAGYTANQAFRWEAESGLTLLEGPDGETQSYALAVSADGSLVVGTVITADGSHATRWNPDESAELLPVPDGATASEALALSDDGSIIVGTVWLGDETQAIAWTDAGFELLEGPTPSNARGIDAAGTRIIGVADGEPGVWDGAAKFVGLRDRVTGAELDDWLLRDVADTSSNGGVLVGTAEFTGANASSEPRAFVAFLP